MSFEIYYNDQPLHPNCFSYTLTVGSQEVEQKLYKCERCHNRKANSYKILPVDPNTFCVNCKNQWKLLMYITEE